MRGELVKTIFISMPWARRDILSIQLGGLTAYLRNCGFDIDTRYYYKDIVSYIGVDCYSEIVVNCLGDLVFSPFYSPQKRTVVKEYLQNMWGEEFVFDELYNNIERFINDILNDVDWIQYDNVAFTTSLVQFVPSLFMAKKIKEINPDINVIVGGASLVGDIADSVLETFSEVDFVIKGEGEKTFEELLREIESGKQRYRQIDGIVYRTNSKMVVSNVERELLHDINTLPQPIFDEYFNNSLTDDFYPPIITVESSRGCFWGRCSFCNLNSQWNNTYREKKPEKVADEIKNQAEKYKLVDFFFTDSNVSNKKKLFDLLQTHGIEYVLHAEVSGHLSRNDFVNMRKAGMRDIQIGIEAFSASLLKKYAKGVSVMRNLEMLKWCSELGIRVFYNVITGFPTTTQEEVYDTLRNMQYAQYYQYPAMTGYSLSYKSEVYNNYNKYKITDWKIPDEVCQLYDEKFLGKTAPLLSAIVGYEIIQSDKEKVDWSTVIEFCEEWKHSYEKNKGKCGLLYYNGGSFIVIKKSLYGREEQYTLDGIAKDIYIYCINESKNINQIYEQFCEEKREDIDELINELQTLELMFCENDKCFSLAINEGKKNELEDR